MKNFLRFLKRISTLFIIISIPLYILLWFNFDRIEATSSLPQMGYEEYNLSIGEKLILENSKGQKMTGVYVDNNSETTVYYFHGNGGSLNMFESHIKFLSDLGYNVLSYDYPAYGESEGFPYTQDIYENTQMFYDYAKKTYNFEKIVSFGYSIGSTQATHFAYTNKVDKLILMSALSSRKDMAKKLLKIDAYSFFFKNDTFISKDKIKKITAPTLVIHGDKDKLIPFWMGELLFKNSGAKDKIFVKIDGAGHNHIVEQYSKDLEIIFPNFISGESFKSKDITVKDTPEKTVYHIFDLDTDASVTKFTSAEVPFNDKKYIPANLSTIDKNLAIKDNMQLSQIANIALNNMNEEFKKDLGYDIKIISAYRSYAYQKGIKDRGCSDKF